MAPGILNTLPRDHILRKHNLEMVITKNLEPKVPFLTLLPLADNDTGEFATVLEAPTAKQDMDEGILSEPLEVAEGTELTDVTVSPINADMGNTIVTGYQFPFTKKFLKRQDSEQRLNLATSKIIAGMAHKLNAIFAHGLITSAAAAFPDDLSDWANAIDPRADFIKLRSAFNSGSAGNEDLPFKLDTSFITNQRHVLLQDYYMSMDKPFNSESMDVDGTTVNNLMNALNAHPEIEYIGLDSSVPPGIINKYVDPDYSTIKQAELADPQKTLDIPQSLINVNLVVPDSITDPYIYQVVAEVGYASVDPLGVQVGKLTP